MSNKSNHRSTKRRRNKHRNEWPKPNKSGGVGGESHKVSKARKRDKQQLSQQERRRQKKEVT